MADALSKVLPLVIASILLAVVSGLCFIAYRIACEVADNTSKKMEAKNVSLGREGMKVGVKHRSTEEVGDRTQSVLIKAWNASSWPDYKSRLGWGQAEPPKRNGGTGAGKSR